jgi:hypothetical protein
MHFRKQHVLLLLLKFSFISISLSQNEPSHPMNGIDSEMHFSSPFTPSLVSDASKQLNLSVIPLEDKQRILIISTARSGSSFVGDLLQQAWPSDYLHEPLNYLWKSLKFDKNKLNEKENIRIIAELFQCIGIRSFSKLEFRLFIEWNFMIHERARLMQGEFIHFSS